MKSSEILSRIGKQFAIPVLRHNDREKIYEISLALAHGGLSVVEITMMNEASADAIRRLSGHPECLIGAGTVRTKAQAELAYEMRAQFIVSPGFDDGVAEFCRSKELLYIPGALTPSEVQRASNQGFGVLKIFPAQAMGGPQYLKHLSGPFPDLSWMATGGVSASDIPEYMKAKAFAVGLGSQLLPAGSVENSRWEEIERAARDVVAEVSKLKP